KGCSSGWIREYHCFTQIFPSVITNYFCIGHGLIILCSDNIIVVGNIYTSVTFNHFFERINSTNSFFGRVEIRGLAPEPSHIETHKLLDFIVYFSIAKIICQFLVSKNPKEANIIDGVLTLLKKVFSITEVVSINHVTKSNQMLRHVTPAGLSRSVTHNIRTRSEVMNRVTAKTILLILFLERLYAVIVQLIKELIKLFSCHS